MTEKRKEEIDKLFEEIKEEKSTKEEKTPFFEEKEVLEHDGEHHHEHHHEHEHEHHHHHHHHKHKRAQKNKKKLGESIKKFSSNKGRICR